MKLNRRSLMMGSIKLKTQPQIFIIITLLIVVHSCINASCNIVHRTEINNNKTEELLNNNRQEDIIPFQSFDNLKTISKDYNNNIDLNDSKENNINIPNNLKYSELQNFNSAEDFKLIQKFLLKYVKTTLFNNFVDLLSGRNMDTISKDQNRKSFNIFKKQFYQFIIENKNENELRSMESGRLFLYKGLKNLLWPLFIGVQIAKSIVVALFLPSLLGSLGLMVGKKLSSISGNKHHSPPVADLEFPDTVFPLDDQYKNPRPEASETHIYRQPIQPFTTNLKNDNILSKFEFIDQFSNGDSELKNKIQKKKNIFEDFLKVPGSSLLLSNYDPFYSPLLSRIDSVFSQFKIEKDKEDCKSKLICLMYANPAKYAPYSNLVSAQLSRELNELQKPMNDNQEIIRFFKYMQAAKNGQDGNNCEKLYDSCTDFKDSDTPVMITTYNDINKLVQAKKFSN